MFNSGGGMRRLWMWLGMTMAMGPTTATAMPVTELPWRAVNDTVMGGVSRGQVAMADREGTEVVRFDGVLSLEQNGGFASIRAPVPPGALDDATALRVVVRGDGRTYDLTLRRADVPLRAGSYRAPLPTDQGVTEVVVPLSSFRPRSYGRPVAGAPALDSRLDLVDTIGIMLADKQPGPFALDILEVAAIRGEGPASADRSAVVSKLVAAIDAGVPLFNSGRVDACRQTYAQVLASVREHGALSPGERSLVGEALDEAREQRDDAAAWTLRYAIDSVLRGS